MFWLRRVMSRHTPAPAGQNLGSHGFQPVDATRAHLECRRHGIYLLDMVATNIKDSMLRAFLRD
jgi:hypothetical protein